MTESITAAKERVQFEAWINFLLWAIKEPEIVLRFTAATGFSHADMIAADNDQVMGAFSLWATENLWGSDVPAAHLAHLKASYVKSKFPRT